MKGKPGSFEWWASLVAHVAHYAPKVIVEPSARAAMQRVLRPAALRAVLANSVWRGREVYPTKGNRRCQHLPGYLAGRCHPFHVADIIKHFVPTVVRRWLRPGFLIVPKGTRTHMGCAAHMTRIERVWALYVRFPASPIAQQMLVACANALRRKGRVIPPMGGTPVSLKALAKLPNMELRRVVVEMRGVALPTRALASDTVGKLYRVNDNQNLLEVKCPSTGRRYLLGVPVRERDRYDDKLQRWVPVPLNTPTRAQRWTLGLTQDEVELVAQT